MLNQSNGVDAQKCNCFLIWLYVFLPSLVHSLPKLEYLNQVTLYEQTDEK